ncbi:MAG: hypothetical protein MZV70_14025 [Desulfobacterales bacterium]|nr:hypothetical protein [Desulfobacterales bacterium]
MIVDFCTPVISSIALFQAITLPSRSMAKVASGRKLTRSDNRWAVFLYPSRICLLSTAFFMLFASSSNWNRGSLPFVDIKIGTVVERCNNNIFLSLPGENNERDITEFSMDVFEEGNTVHPWHLVIGNNGIVGFQFFGFYNIINRCMLHRW